MNLPYKRRWKFLSQGVFLSLMLVFLVGCGGTNGDKEVNRHEDDPKQDTDTEVLSAHHFLDSSDVEKFQPGRSQKDILADVQWRGHFLMAGSINGKSVSAISFNLFAEVSKNESGDVVFAIFEDDKFVKFIEWFSGEKIVVVDIEGRRISRPMPIKIGDLDWLPKAAESEPINLAQLEKEVRERPEAPSQVDPGLTAVFVFLKATSPAGTFSATKKDLQRNAELRDQFNAARLKLGMTEAEVEAVLKAKPLESGKVEAGPFKVYGSNEKFNIAQSLHFSNILVVFKDGKLNTIYGINAWGGWRENLKESFIDWPVSQ